MSEQRMDSSKKGARIRLTWKRDDEDDVKRAREFFMRLTKQGWLAVRRGDKSRRVLDFKREYEELWFIPLSEGG